MFLTLCVLFVDCLFAHCPALEQAGHLSVFKHS